MKDTIFFIFLVLLLEISILFLCYHSITNRILSKPFFRYKLLKETNMGLVYELVCDKPVDADVVERRLTVTVNGSVIGTETYSGEVTNLGEKSFTQGDSVELSLVDVDDVGNVSEPAILNFVAADTLAPSVPGLSVNLIREE